MHIMKAGNILRGGVAAAALTGGYFEYQHYREELVLDRTEAAISQLFLDNQEGIRADITAMMAEVDARTQNAIGLLGSACTKLASGEKLLTAEDIHEANTCDLREDLLDDTRTLFIRSNTERNVLARYVEGNNPRLEIIAQNAREEISDAAIESLWSDTFDNYPAEISRPIGLMIREGSIIEIEASESPVSPILAIIWGGALTYTVFITAIEAQEKMRANNYREN